jgi:ribonuclease BN (tRNA processing enzyme)
MTRVRFVGSGDAFGDGGRSQACILLEHDGFRALLDCGATSLTALRRLDIDPSTVDAVLLTHFHGDHAGGVPYLILDGQFKKRTRGLVIAGPPGVRARMTAIFEAALPTSSATRQAFDVSYVELAPTPTTIGPLSVEAFPVAHLPATEPHALRVRAGGGLVGYTGDTEWCDALVRVADGADLFIAEAYSFDKSIPQHLSHAALVANRAQLRARRVVLVHPGPETLARRADLAWDLADDGMEIVL